MDQRSASLVAIPVSKSKLWGLILSGNGRKNYGKPVRKGKKVRTSPSRSKPQRGN